MNENEIENVERKQKGKENGGGDLTFISMT
jgi:hypothetical protein